ncbi:GDSL-type esterase/lipase family protein, partial [Argonema antarcticum]|uniref:GDSL-type esterase/lipase family protein n=1 Tax=Argonema antarcticum TaxID=2942763 RepID=UPI0020121199
MSFKIMPLGDSISYGVVNSQVGDTESGGYRTELWNLFGADNFSADMVGSISSGPSNIDRNNEGHRGWRIDEISSSVDGWLTTYQPDAIMLMIGTNDILQNYDVSNAGNRLNTLVDKITSKVPNARLFLGSIPPSFKFADDAAQVATFNTQVLQIANNKVSQGKKVTFVDINSKLNENDLADKIHPTIDGYTKIGNAWYDALLPFTDIKKTTRIQAEDMTLTNYSVESGNSSALARKVISLVNTPNATGIASFNFSGTSGKYDVVLGYYDENDGQAQLKVKIGGNQVDQWTLNQNLGSASVNSQTKTRRTVATSFTLNQGTKIEIQGTANQTEYGRVDYVELIPNEISSTASLSATNITEDDETTHTFSVTYTDNDGVNLSTIDGNDIRVTGTNNFNQLAYLVGVNQSGADVTGFYRINAPGGSWDTADNGTYNVALQNGEVKDTQNNAFPSGNLGTFQVNVPPPLGNIRIEAENMQRTTYLVESNSAASNGQLISLAQSGGSSGTATTTFNGASGIYDVVVRYFDENDGLSTLTAKIGGTTIAQSTFNQNLGNSGANSQTAVTKTIATSLSINQGTTIQLQGLANQGEFARVDYIEFVPVVTPSPPADVTLPTASLSADNITEGNGTTQ